MLQLLKCLKDFKRDAILTPILVALETVGELCLTLIIGRFIDELSSTGTTMGTIWSYGLRQLLVAVVCLVLGTISSLTSTKAAAGLSKNLRDEMFSRIQDFSFTNIRNCSKPTKSIRKFMLPSRKEAIRMNKQRKGTMV